MPSVLDVPTLAVLCRQSPEPSISAVRVNEMLLRRLAVGSLRWKEIVRGGHVSARRAVSGSSTSFSRPSPERHLPDPHPSHPAQHQAYSSAAPLARILRAVLVPLAWRVPATPEGGSRRTLHPLRRPVAEGELATSTDSGCEEVTKSWDRAERARLLVAGGMR